MRRSPLSVAATLALAAAVSAPAAAQETSHPAGIYVGTCPVPGNAVVSLWDASPNYLVDGESDVGESVGSQAGFPVEASVTIVEMPLAELTATEHAILVHRSQAEMDDYIACGEIGGLMMGVDELPVALAPVGLSPWSGVAILDDEGNGTTTVSIFLFEGPGLDSGAEEVPAGQFPSPFPSPFPEQAFDDQPATPPRDDDPDVAQDDRGNDRGDDEDTDGGGGGSGDDTEDD